MVREGQIKEGSWAAAIIGPLAILFTTLGGGLGLLFGLAAVIVGALVVTRTDRPPLNYQFMATLGIATGGIAFLVGIFA